MILKFRITVCNYSVEPSIQNHNRVLDSFVSTQLFPDATSFFICPVTKLSPKGHGVLGGHEINKVRTAVFAIHHMRRAGRAN